MIFLPYSTDAPIYHLPIATGAIILANVVIFLATTFQVQLGNLEPESIQWLILEFNQINPLQWITGSFMHEGLFHLLGNMFFLWAFGLVIEGKIGGIAFTILYFVIALIDGAMIQVPMFFISGESAALGASGAIFGLMMIAVIWAPENEMDCFYWFFIMPGTVEVRIIALGVVFVFLQIVFLFFGGFGMSSEMLHIVGAIVGVPIGFMMLRQGMVDCEGWDIVSRNEFLQEISLFRSEGQRNKERQNELTIENPVEVALGEVALGEVALGGAPPRKRPPLATNAHSNAHSNANTKTKRRRSGRNSEQQPRVTLRNQAPEAQGDAISHPEFNRLSFVFRQSLESKNVATADQVFHRLQQLKLTSGLSDRLLFQYSTLLGASRRGIDALGPLQLIARRDGTLANDARLRIGLVHLRMVKNFDQAIDSLEQIIDSPDLKPEVRKKRDEMLAEARKGR